MAHSAVMQWCSAVMQWIRACSGVVQGSDVQCCAADGIVSLYLCCTAGVAMTCTGFEWLSVRLTSGHPG
mgnify:CR=1 FL=1